MNKKIDYETTTKTHAPSDLREQFLEWLEGLSESRIEGTLDKVRRSYPEVAETWPGETMNDSNARGFDPVQMIKSGQESGHDYNTFFMALQKDGTLRGRQYMHDSVSDCAALVLVGMKTCHEQFGFHPEAIITVTFKKTDSAGYYASTLKMILNELSCHSHDGGAFLKWDKHLQTWCATIMPQSLNNREKRLLKDHGLKKVPLKSDARK